MSASLAKLAIVARAARTRRRAAIAAARRADLELLAANTVADAAERALAEAIASAIWGDTRTAGAE